MTVQRCRMVIAMTSISGQSGHVASITARRCNLYRQSYEFGSASEFELGSRSDVKARIHKTAPVASNQLLLIPTFLATGIKIHRSFYDSLPDFFVE